jgi:hypothetical protein
MPRPSGGLAALSWLRLAAALLLLNASLTFVNVWPTLGIRLSPQLSLEVAILALGLAAVGWAGRAPVSRTAQRFLAAGWVVLVVAHYVGVTAQSLYGREFNLYWDLQLLPDVGAMFAAVARPRVLVALVAALILVPVLLFLPVRWAIGALSRACAAPVSRWAVSSAAIGVLLVGGVQALAGGVLDRTPVAPPVTAAIAGEVTELAREALGRDRRTVPAAPSIDSDLAYVQGADVVVLFVESYGVTSWERPEFREAMAPLRVDLAAAIADGRRAVVSSTVESTTFGGESWLAHISLLSGTEVRDADLNRRLMAERRDTMVTAFARRGYRTLAVMPGLHAAWPEGRFYGFDHLYGAPDLGYEGPPFGWWDLTDQFVLARMDTLAFSSDAKAPAFVFMPTISTHTPFTPVPPYQPDWSRLLTATPYDTADLEKAYDDVADWSNLGPGYARALGYLHRTLTGYLRWRADRDLVLVVIGDHQPPALVTGEGASWNVPVHVITGREPLLDRLRAQGFRDGLEPPAEALTRMDGLMTRLLQAFGNTQ